MKLPNGYGSVVKYKGNRRRPFTVRKTIGFNEKGHPVYKVLGWAATREEGYKMLADYNHEPWNTDLANITFADLYTMWRDQHESTLTKSTRGYVSAAYAHSASLYSMKYKSIRSYHFQNAIDSCDKSYATKAGLRTLYRKLDRYAFELDIISKRYSDLITLPPKDTKEK